MTYAQDKEDDFVASLFHPGFHGRFLDLGAYDGHALSNTRLFVERGWGGTFVEPGLKAFTALCRHYPVEHFPAIQLVHAGIGSALQLVCFHERGLASTFDVESKATMDALYPAVPWLAYFTPIITVAELIRACPGPYHFISIDVEGLNMEVLEQLPLAELDTRVVCIEHDNAYETLERLLPRDRWDWCWDNTVNLIARLR